MVAEAPLGKRRGAAQKLATTRLGRWFVSLVLACVVSRPSAPGSVIRSGEGSCRITDQRLGCSLAHCSQTSAGIWHRAQPPQRPRVCDGRASCPKLRSPHGACAYVFSWTQRRRTLAGWLVTTTRQCYTAQSSFNCRVAQIPLLWTSFWGTSS